MFHHMEGRRDSPVNILTIHHKEGKDSQAIEIIEVIAKDSAGIPAKIYRIL